MSKTSCRREVTAFYHTLHGLITPRDPSRNFLEVDSIPVHLQIYSQLEVPWLASVLIVISASFINYYAAHCQVFDRPALLQTKEFQVIDANTGQVVGVRLPCPHCRSNGFTMWSSWSDVSLRSLSCMLKFHDK